MIFSAMSWIIVIHLQLKSRQNLVCYVQSPRSDISLFFIIAFYRNIKSFYRIIMSFYRIIIAIYRNN